ncbi:uncharacterized protein BYT42DRAFT_618956 [Radiomyces spectabilis]|uniref:uncharacterized protein n=1 Tax=Radiomyces spectabilis TaxID=64574 RepID=UPI00221E3F83|nr:uncharacterized protein BYT42DRAFT_618956 [Radiomyces spectabilis]KAI8364354.1 hypothetical protein BYT42DRAFT_618956 [Radiomyces spectabilis]
MSNRAVSFRPRHNVAAAAVNQSAVAAKPMMPKQKPTAHQLKSPSSHRHSSYKKKKTMKDDKKEEEETDKKTHAVVRVNVSVKKPATSGSLSAPLKKKSPSAPNTPHPKRPIITAKARRAERRREIGSVTDALQKAQMDHELSTSPPSFTSISSTDSDDSDTTYKKKMVTKSPRFQVPNHNQKQSHQSIPPAAAFPPLHQPRKRQENVRQRRRSSSVVDLRSQVYAGPTFNNAPAPSALPMPAFIEEDGSATALVLSETHRPHTVSMNLHMRHHLLHDHDEIFLFENHHHHHHPHHYPRRTHHHHPLALEQQSKDLLSLLAPTTHASTGRSSKYPIEPDHALSEIQRGLRSMLKIEAAS